MAYFPDGMPVPGATMDTQEFWDHCKQHELRVQRCTRCWTYRFPPAPVCYKCHSFEYEWVQSRGEARVYSYVIVHHPPHPAVREVVPYNVAIIELDDCGQTRFTSNVVDCPNEEVRVGLPVELVWEDVSPEVALYRFRPRKE